MRKKVTKPKQAGSAKSLDRWKLVVRDALVDVNQLRELRCAPAVVERLGARLEGLLRSLGRAEMR